MPEMTPREAGKLADLLEEQLPPKVSYANLVGADSCYGDTYVWEDPEPYMIAEAIQFLRAIAAGEYKQVVHAHWKEIEPDHDILFECSNCGRIISTSWGSCEDEDTKGNNSCDPTEEWLCCPTCNVIMDGKDDSHAD